MACLAFVPFVLDVRMKFYFDGVSLLRGEFVPDLHIIQGQRRILYLNGGLKLIFVLKIRRYFGNQVLDFNKIAGFGIVAGPKKRARRIVVQGTVPFIDDRLSLILFDVAGYTDKILGVHV
jgi:hypothetical protein